MIVNNEIKIRIRAPERSIGVRKHVSTRSILVRTHEVVKTITIQPPLNVKALTCALEREKNRFGIKLVVPFAKYMRPG